VLNLSIGILTALRSPHRGGGLHPLERAPHSFAHQADWQNYYTCKLRLRFVTSPIRRHDMDNPMRNPNKHMKAILPFIFLAFIACAQKTEKPIEISKVKFKSIFGTDSTNESQIYSLQGTGFFQSHRSENTDSLISDWINKHPKALIYKVSSFGPIDMKDKNSKMIYCWVLDGKDTLNSYIVRQGCVSGGTMMLAKNYDEIEIWQKKLFEGSDEKTKFELYVNKEQYNAFMEQLKSAETYAFENLLGIWKEKEAKSKNK